MSRLTATRAVVLVLAPHKRRLTALAIVTCAGALLHGVGDPVSLKLLVDTLGRGDARSFVVLACVFLVLYTVVRLARWRSALLTQRLKNDVYEHITTGMFRTFFRLPYQEVTKDSGYYISRISDEPLQISKGTDVIIKMLSAAVTVTGALIVCLMAVVEDCHCTVGNRSDSGTYVTAIRQADRGRRD